MPPLPIYSLIGIARLNSTDPQPGLVDQRTYAVELGSRPPGPFRQPDPAHPSAVVFTGWIGIDNRVSLVASVNEV
jgi:hypothetical protein